MRVSVYSARPYDRRFLSGANSPARHDLVFLEAHLDARTASLAEGSGAVCAFVNDRLDRDALAALARVGIQLIALRSAGFNNIDLDAATEFGITVARVPAYSPHAVAEHAVGLVLSLNRKLHRAYPRVRDGNFSLDGLLGFDLHGRTVGVVGTGHIGTVFARIMSGFGCRVLAADPSPNEECRASGVEYVALEALLAAADIVSLHCPLTPETRHLIDEPALDHMRSGVMLINTGRGALVDTAAVISALKRGHIGALGMDVYEEEEGLFFEDLSGQVIQDDVFMRLLTFPNVVVTAHLGFFTEDALRAIAEATIGNITAFEAGTGPLHQVGERLARPTDL
ncbi:MAG: 2-hydroxyacid dehydrogenase [Gemmatimonadales bacterium]